jgi:surfactin synthase thioesterase subunit
VSDWLVRRTRRAHATHRLYCYPYAGGSPGEFLRWEARLPDLEIIGILPPGRGRRLHEPPFTRATDLVDALIRDVDFTPPFLLFGHSLGALLAYETARALRDAGRAAPAALIVSAHRPPDLPHADRPIHDLPDGEFRAIVAERYPAPDELAEDPELLAEVYRTLRSDLAVFETYRHPPARPLGCPILVISGTADHWSEADLAGWARRTTTSCTVHLIDGDHFYVNHHPDDAIKIIRELAAGRPA